MCQFCPFDCADQVACVDGNHAILVIRPQESAPYIFSKKIRTPAERNSIEALEQLYGYMTFNDNKYGVLSNWTRAWFLRRVEKDGGGKTLECPSVELDGSANSSSMLKALVGMVLLAEKDWLYAFSTPSIIPSPSRIFGDSRTAQNAQKKAIKAAQNYSVALKNGTYPYLDLDLRLCDFQLSTA